MVFGSYFRSKKFSRNKFSKCGFSDGTDKEIEKVLKLNNVISSPFSKSISDLLAIAKYTAIMSPLVWKLQAPSS